jgi:hypothetical protein
MMAYNRQTNNHNNVRLDLHASRTFNGPVHTYIENVTGDGSFVACSQVTYVEPGDNMPISFSGTAVLSEQTVPRKHYHDNQRQMA